MGTEERRRHLRQYSVDLDPRTLPVVAKNFVITSLTEDSRTFVVRRG
jgi:hypothetical protein